MQRESGVAAIEYCFDAALAHAEREARRQPAMNLAIARVYLHHSDPAYATRTWQQVIDEIARLKTGETRARWQRAMRQKPFELLRTKVLIETRSQDFLDLLSSGTVCTNIFLRRLHNFALDMDWLPKPIIPRRLFPRIEFKDKRAVTPEEHAKIVKAEKNPEWRAFYNLLWQIGGSQTDVATLDASAVDWTVRTVAFPRNKTGSVVQLHFGPDCESILLELPREGFLFPNLARMHEKDRAKQFGRRCRLAGVQGVCLHSYRYAWAERARVAGYPERFAQEALGHKSAAVHRSYARKAKVRIPSLEEYESASFET